MIDVVETLLARGASVTAVDAKGVAPPLACAANEDVAMCLAMILSVFLSTPANSEARRSICSLSCSSKNIRKYFDSKVDFLTTFSQATTLPDLELFGTCGLLAIRAPELECSFFEKFIDKFFFEFFKKWL
jgi:hypothetical protein